MHEHIPRYTPQSQGSSDRSFGLVFAAFFLLVGLLPLVHSHGIKSWCLLLSGAFFLLALVCPSVLAPANQLWVQVGLLLHRIVSPIALGVLFFAVVTPTGLIMRLLGKDLLRLRPHPSTATYWISRTPPGPDPDSLKNQF
ncbi:MAG: hypothetical protein BWK76_18910 [Desulfobulbaceae bacterium A2]|nr:MAG: hypothetical protein BWK76_18910 [Desulfobulbaceae bacterium A2]